MTVSIKQSDYRFPGGIHQRRDFPVHMRQFKQEVYNCFKNCTAAVTSTDTELDYCYRLPNYLKQMQIMDAVMTSRVVSGATAYGDVVTADPTITEYVDGMVICLRFDAPLTSTAAGVSIKIDSLPYVEVGPLAASGVFPGAGAIMTFQYTTDIQDSEYRWMLLQAGRDNS